MGIIFSLFIFVYRNYASTLTLKLVYNPTKVIEYSPISTLPVELLLEIFRLASMDDRSGQKTKIAITHVCYFWREIAVSCPRMWSSIDISRATTTELSRIREFRSRSKDAPLSISVESAICLYHQGHHLQNFITDSLPNARILSCSADIFRLELLCPAPILESLTLTSGHHSHDDLIPETAFEGHTPRLRKVVLWNVPFSWQSTFLNNLTELSVHVVAFFEDDHLLLLDCLERMPGLQKLELRSTRLMSDVDFSIESPPSRKLVLSSLRKFVFSYNLELCSFIFDNLVLPQKLHIELDIALTASDDYLPSLKKVASFAAARCRAPNARLGMTRKTGDPQMPDVHLLSYSHGNVWFEIMIFGPLGSHFSAIETLRAALPVKDILHMELGGDVVRWSRLYRRMENVRYLTISAFFMTDFLRALANGLLRELAVCDFLPRLEMLTIRDVDSRRLSGAAGGLTFAQMLRPCLEARLRAGKGIRVLHISTACGGSNDEVPVNGGAEVAILKGLVDDIYVDFRLVLGRKVSCL